MTFLSDLSWVSFLTGGLAGASLTAFATWRRGLNERSLQILEQYFARFDDIERIYLSLGNANSFDQETDYGLENLNRVHLVGDWMDIAAMLYIKRLANREVLSESGLIQMIRDFRAYLKAYGSPVSDRLDNWKFSKRLEQWPYGCPSTRKIENR